MKKSFILIAVLLYLTGCEKSKSFYFVHISDTQLGMIENDAGFSHETKIVGNTVSAINRLNPAFVVITGDLVNKVGDAEQIKELKRLFAQVKKSIPVLYVPGNHDVGQTATDELLTLYMSNFDYDVFSVVYKNTKLISINSQLIQAKRSELEDIQYQWLKKELEDSGQNAHRFIFSHHPLFLQSVDEEDSYQNLPVEYRKKYVDLFNEHNVSHMFTGHLHRNHVFLSGSLTTVATNAVCVSHSDEPPGLRIVKVYPDRVEHDYYSLETLPKKIKM